MSDVPAIDRSLRRVARTLVIMAGLVIAGGLAASALTAAQAASTARADQPSAGAPTSTPAGTAAGRALAARAIASRDTSGFSARARAVLTPASATSSVLQLRLLGRRDAGVTRILVQVLWPTSLKGHAVVIERRSGGALAGFVFDPPDRQTPLDAVLLTSPFAGSGLTVEDLADSFWDWPAQHAGGRTTDGRASCNLLESRPPRDVTSAYGLVRSCLDTRSAAPRWIDKSDRAGHLVKRLRFERAEKAGTTGEGAFVMTVSGGQTAEGESVVPTRVEFLRSDRDATVPASAFEPAALARLGQKLP